MNEKWKITMAVMVEEKNTSPIVITTTEILSGDIKKLSESIGCKEKALISHILSVGYKTINELTKGNDAAVTRIVDNKLVTVGIKDNVEPKIEASTPTSPIV